MDEKSRVGTARRRLTVRHDGHRTAPLPTLRKNVCRQLNPPNSQMIRMIGSGMPISHKSNPRPIVSLHRSCVAITPAWPMGSVAHFSGRDGPAPGQEAEQGRNAQRDVGAPAFAKPAQALWWTADAGFASAGEARSGQRGDVPVGLCAVDHSPWNVNVTSITWLNPKPS
jgi:hypothetical protein